MQQCGSVFLNTNSELHHSCVCRDTAGTVLNRRTLESCRILESAYTPGLTLTPHMHSRAYFNFILEGAYTETYDGYSEECGAGALRFLPANAVHANSYHDGARCLLIEIAPESIARMADHTTIVERPGEVKSPKAAWLARRLYSEFREQDDAASLAMEGLILELIAEQARDSTKGAPRIGPRWLQHAKEVIHDRHLEALTLTEIASEVRVHPVHLSREFHRYHGCTVGDYIRKLRIEHASHLLADTDTSLSEIALGCGFADQSHFSATFKRATGITPARFRALNAR